MNPVPVPHASQPITETGVPTNRIWLRFFNSLASQAIGGTFNTAGAGLVSAPEGGIALEIPVLVANGGTGEISPSGTSLDNIAGFSATGFLKRTGAGAYSFIADPLPVAHGGTGHNAAGGASVDAISGFAGTGFLQRTGTATYAFVADPLPVANGGTAAATASGTALDNISGFASTGILQRTGAGAYSFLATPGVVPEWVTAPAHNTSAGTVGQIAQDGSFFYVCTASSTWARVAIGGAW